MKNTFFIAAIDNFNNLVDQFSGCLSMPSRCQHGATSHESTLLSRSPNCEQAVWQHAMDTLSFFQGDFENVRDYYSVDPELLRMARHDPD